MRIGITTFYNSQDNYGQLLQAYATTRFLKELGHDPFIIGYKEIPQATPSLRSRITLKKMLSRSHWKFVLSPIYKPIHRKFIEIFYQRHDINRQFDEFRHKYLTIYPSKTITELRQNPPEADVYMTGSDQVWGGSECNPFYFLDFGDSQTPRISISASIGQILKDLTDKRREEFRANLQRFTAVTVREHESLHICKNAGTGGAKLICDPTMLHDAQSYLQFIQELPSQQPMTMVYYIGNKSTIRTRDLLKAAKSLGQPIEYITANGEINHHHKSFPTIKQWLASIRDAKYILTNSFHGTVFSILFHKQFVVIPLRSEGANERLRTLLGYFNLTDRICKDESMLAEIMRSSPIDYQRIEPLITELRLNSRKILNDILQGISHEA